MADVKDSVTIYGMRYTHFDQLLSYVDERDRTGWYYGRRDQFEARHKELKAWLENLVKNLQKTGVIIPKCPSCGGTGYSDDKPCTVCAKGMAQACED